MAHKSNPYKKAQPELAQGVFSETGADSNCESNPAREPAFVDEIDEFFPLEELEVY